MHDISFETQTDNKARQFYDLTKCTILRGPYSEKTKH